MRMIYSVVSTFVRCGAGGPKTARCDRMAPVAPNGVHVTDLTGLRAVVTGATSILGQHIARIFSDAGAQGMVADTNTDEPAKLSELMRLILEAPYLLIRAALNGMRERGFGRIITLSSNSGVPTSVYSAMFAAANLGLEHASRVTALEGGTHGVTSNVIDPGFVHTPTAPHIPVNPNEIADLVLWLTSSDADLISGTSYSMRTLPAGRHNLAVRPGSCREGAQRGDCQARIIAS